MAPQARDLIVGDARARVQEIQAVHDAILDAGLFTKPFVFLSHLDTGIAERTLEQFTPALPLDLEGIVYSAMGLLTGFIAYELIKLPFGLTFRKKKPA